MRTDLAAAKAESFQLLKRSRNLTDQKWVANGFVFLVNIYQKTGHPDSAEYYLDLLTRGTCLSVIECFIL